MNSPLPTDQVSALAFLYNKGRDECRWLRTLTPNQMQTIASLMMEWQRGNERYEILPLEDIERREIMRAVAFFEGNAHKAARSLKIGKTTMYRKLAKWGYRMRDRMAFVQASALADPAERKRTLRAKSIAVSASRPMEPWHQSF